MNIHLDYISVKTHFNTTHCVERIVSITIYCYPAGDRSLLFSLQAFSYMVSAKTP